MNARRGGYDILTQSPFYDHRNSQHETLLERLQNSTLITYGLATVLVIYFILNYTGVAPSSIPQALWNLVVHLTPSRIVVVLDSKTTNPDSTDQNLHSMSFQAKSEAMQRILGLNHSSFAAFLPRSNTFSGFGTALLGNKDSLPPGLGNWDNSCYQNSIIQGLASLDSLEEFLGRNIQDLGEKGPLSTHAALKTIIERLNSADNHSQRLWTPADLKSMSSWQQQDAQEYFAKVVGQIDQEVQQATKRQTNNLGLKMAGPGEHIVGSGALSRTLDDVQDSLSRRNHPPRNPLEGLLAQRVGCMKCGWTEGLSLIPFNCLTLPLGVKYEYDLRDCLDQYMHLEPIEGVECAKCTLLRAKDQLGNLLKQIEDDAKLQSGTESPNMSNALQTSAQERLRAVEEALEEDDFAEKTLTKKCHIPTKSRVTSIKSRQAVIARTPNCLVIHINRSVFDENTGMLRKNHAAVRFPNVLDLNEWCLGKKSSACDQKDTEQWDTDPRESMLPEAGSTASVSGRLFQLQAVVTHYGRHENGHYICYRKYSSKTFPTHVPDTVVEADGEKEKSERWFRLSDDDVQMVSEASVMSQGGVFMLFYEMIDRLPSEHTEMEHLYAAEGEETESISSFVASEDMSTTSTITEGSCDTSPATSVSASARAETPFEKV
ncbi:ubiquitin-specific protease UBP1 [Aspergillus clavatus NRRL 1]|uniref:ubiquitinyl hydrolase 1 n=1 Tax=Aspergillus clavatus (strain ATCC 1007 / CBS 513.65 / DSM 816 / NCTC 3887 / NRRL 1 / QM 1276 / 107) TaxID=344612 RepID=A1CBU8_ASPCL|nr:ubiquitin C-terminal hydrolase, putative [Aspergillus clavatus NRRL 1]EAW13216.1 ubiquitin C-terminal hydrolase, putative [Aspergillus clavatus NRRL 1]